MYYGPLGYSTRCCKKSRWKYQTFMFYALYTLVTKFKNPQVLCSLVSMTFPQENNCD